MGVRSYTLQDQTRTPEPVIPDWSVRHAVTAGSDVREHAITRPGVFPD
jgi:hypothetical protein